jgi:CheY-like chemotaxis protein
MMTQTSILIIGEKESFIIRVLMKKLEEAHIQSVFSLPSIDAVNQHLSSVSLVTYYLEPNEMPSTEILTYLSDHLRQDNKEIILIGEPSDTDAVQKVIPQSLVYKVFKRPLDYEGYILAVNMHSLEVSEGVNKKSILIVDDDPNYMSLIREWLKDSYKVSMATSGLRAMKWLGAENKDDLILLDYEMPVTDGPQVLEMLRSDEETKHIPVIFLTGRGDKESVMSVMSLKPQGYLLKTISRAELLDKLSAFFDRA